MYRRRVGAAVVVAVGLLGGTAATATSTDGRSSRPLAAVWIEHGSEGVALRHASTETGPRVLGPVGARSILADTGNGRFAYLGDESTVHRVDVASGDLQAVLEVSGTLSSMAVDEETGDLYLSVQGQHGVHIDRYPSREGQLDPNAVDVIARSADFSDVVSAFECSGLSPADLIVADARRGTAVATRTSLGCEATHTEVLVRVADEPWRQVWLGINLDSPTLSPAADLLAVPVDSRDVLIDVASGRELGRSAGAREGRSSSAHRADLVSTNDRARSALRLTDPSGAEIATVELGGEGVLTHSWTAAGDVAVVTYDPMASQANLRVIDVTTGGQVVWTIRRDGAFVSNAVTVEVIR